MPTTSLHQIQQCTIMTAKTSWYRLWIRINTYEITGLFVVPMCCHKVTMILFVPAIRAVIPCGHHELCTSWTDIAHSTGDVVIMHISFERIKWAHFILSAIDGPRPFKMIGVLSIFWLVWQTYMIYSSSCVTMVTISHEAWERDEMNARASIGAEPHNDCGQHQNKEIRR